MSESFDEHASPHNSREGSFMRSKNGSLQVLDHDEIDLREVILLLWRNKFLIAGCSFAFATVAALVSIFHLIPQYNSKAVIMEARDNGASSNFRGMGDSSPFAAFLSFGGPGQTMLRYHEILASRQLVAHIVDENNLLSRLNVEIPAEDPKGRDRAREGLISRLRSATTLTAESAVLRIEVRDPDPVFARDMVKWYLESLRDYIRSNLVTQARSTEIFIAERLVEVETALRETELQYTALKEDQGVVQLPSQINFSLGTASQLRSQIIEKDMQIALYKDIMRDSSEVIRLEQEKKQLETQLLRLIEGSGVSKSESKKLVNIFTPLGDSSALQFKFANAERNYLTQVKLAELLRQQLEMARIESKKSEPVFQIIDEPVESVFPVSPNKRLNTVLGFLLGMIISTFAVLVLNQFQSLPRTITRIIKVDVKEPAVRKSQNLG
jgi:uncharacterized protein involved in exopolysaccharide biosynthesis